VQRARPQRLELIDLVEIDFLAARSVRRQRRCSEQLVKPATAGKRFIVRRFLWGADRHRLAGSCLSRNHSVGLPDGATLITVPFQAFIGHFRPELFQLRRCRLVSVTFRIISSPGHLGGSSFKRSGRERVLSALGSGSCSHLVRHVGAGRLLMSSRMSALGQKQTSAHSCHVRFAPKSGHRLSTLECPLCAISGHSRIVRSSRRTRIGWPDEQVLSRLLFHLGATGRPHPEVAANTSSSSDCSVRLLGMNYAETTACTTCGSAGLPVGNPGHPPPKDTRSGLVPLLDWPAYHFRCLNHRQWQTRRRSHTLLQWWLPQDREPMLCQLHAQVRCSPLEAVGLATGVVWQSATRHHAASGCPARSIEWRLRLR
jgi:hypothetical protein